MIGRAKSHGALAGLVLLFGTAFEGGTLSAQTGLPPDVLRQGSSPVYEVPPGGAPARPEVKAGGGTGVVSADLLRHPITEKVRRMLQKALEKMKSGHHDAAIAQLQETLAKYPESAAYTQSLLGVEYLRTDRFTDAVSSFEEAVVLLPHDPVNRYDLGLSLVCAGDYERGEQEVRRALELDPHNATMKELLDALVQQKLTDSNGRTPAR